jgi:hypothetical protein
MTTSQLTKMKFFTPRWYMSSSTETAMRAGTEYAKRIKRMLPSASRGVRRLAHTSLHDWRLHSLQLEPPSQVVLVLNAPGFMPVWGKMRPPNDRCQLIFTGVSEIAFEPRCLLSEPAYDWGYEEIERSAGAYILRVLMLPNQVAQDVSIFGLKFKTVSITRILE